jgi:ubiquinone/menaquinone biosynthesis C-methylase UbiE
VVSIKCNMALHPLVEGNIVRHDRIAPLYESRHNEIFNRHEQRRIQRELLHAWNLRQTKNRKALDFGAGTGNLSLKLLALDAEVTAADVSAGMLKSLEEKLPREFQGKQLTTHLLTGEDRLPFADNQFAFGAAYSVLHHVPDYMNAVLELGRVIERGGIIYLDHEALEENYASPRPFGLKIHRRLHLSDFGIRETLERMRAPRKIPSASSDLMSEEGDIHLGTDDHIEWTKIRRNLRNAGFEELKFERYLHCVETSPFPWRYWLCRQFAVGTGLYVGIKN